MLPWPDSEGWWWCFNSEPEIVKCEIEDDEIRIKVTGDDQSYERLCKAWYKNARFTKLIEQSPFGVKP